MGRANREQYHEAFKTRGGVFENLKGSPYEHLYYHYYLASIGRLKFLERVLSDQLPAINFGFANNIGLSAFANIVDGVNFIGFGKETPLILKFVYDIMFSHPGFLSGIDNSLEVAPEKIPHVKFQSLRQINAIYDLNACPQPKGEDRKWWSDWMANLATGFLLFHEMGHLLNGHIGYLKDNGLGFEDIDGLTAQTLEVDADKFAARMFFKQVFEITKASAKNLENKEEQMAIERESVCFAYGAVYTLFRLFSNGEVNANEPLRNHHPIPALRELLFRDELYFCFKDREDSLTVAFAASFLDLAYQ